MAEVPGGAGIGKAGVAPRWWRRWPEWVGYAAGSWSLLYGLLGLYWMFGGAGFPFGAGNDPAAAQSALAGVQAESSASMIAALGLIGVAVATAMARTWQRRIVHIVLLAFAWVAAAALLLAVPDFRVLMAVAYTPIILIVAPFGWLPELSLLGLFPWPVVNQFICIVGGLLWAAAAVAYEGFGKHAPTAARPAPR